MTGDRMLGLPVRERTALVGALAVRPCLYVREPGIGELGEPPRGAAIEGLRIRVVGSDERPTFHANTGLYGFLHLRPGTHRLHISDPQGRYLARSATVTTASTEARREALERGVTPPDDDAGPTYHEVVLRPAIGLSIPPAETVIWGQVVDAQKRPLPWSRVVVESARGSRIVTHADLQGVYVAWLHDERSAAADETPTVVIPPGGEPGEIGEVEPPGGEAAADGLTRTFDRAITAHRFLPAIPDEGDLLTAFPAAFDTLSSGAEFDALYALHCTENELITVGRRLRLDLPHDA